jgi:hypothetical protein
VNIPPPIVRGLSQSLPARAWRIVRDDLLPGGSKARILPALLEGSDSWGYASPAHGYAQVALALACRDAGKHATIFTARRAQPHARTLEAAAAGATIVYVRPGYLSVCEARAREWASSYGSKLLPFGLAAPRALELLALAALATGEDPPQVWCAAGSGMLSRALQLAWPQAQHFAVQVGAVTDVGKAWPLLAPERFEQPAEFPPPFPSCAEYDAKVWRFFREHARDGALFWNVAG